MQAINVIILISLIATVSPGHDITWNSVAFFYANLTILLMSLTTILSFRYIHKHSAGVENIGIKTNNSLWRCYVIAWTALGICTLVNTFSIQLLAFDFDKEDVVLVYRRLIGTIILWGFGILISAILQILVLYAYYLLSKRMNTKAVRKLARNLTGSFCTQSSI